MAQSPTGMPGTSIGAPILNRRNLLRASALGAGALAVPSLLAACGGGGGSNSKTVTFGSNYSDAVPKKAMAASISAFEKQSGKTVTVNTVDHNTFQENINRYLKGNPQDVFTWFAGNRMKFFAAQGLATDISDVWGDIGGNFSSAFKTASTGDDGKQYFVPFYNYPWAVFYRKSLFSKNGYSVPKTLDDFTALCKQMKKDGLAPIAFADKDGWPAMGTFDIINMRMNGYQFHIDLMAGKESWTDSKVKQVFDTWAGLLPYHQPGALGRLWQDAAQGLVKKQSGMYLLGMFVSQQFTNKADLDDLDFFPFPEINSQYGQEAIEAPIDGFMVSAKAKNVDGAKELVKFLAGTQAELAYLKYDPSNVGANKNTSQSGYTTLQKKAVELISSAKYISQFMDRDTRPDFASTVMIPSLQTFINKPNDVSSLLSSIEKQKKTIFANE